MNTIRFHVARVNNERTRTTYPFIDNDQKIMSSIPREESGLASSLILSSTMVVPNYNDPSPVSALRHKRRRGADAIDSSSKRVSSCQKRRKVRFDDKIASRYLCFDDDKDSPIEITCNDGNEHDDDDNIRKQQCNTTNELWQTREELGKMRSRAKALSAEIANKSSAAMTKQHQHLSYHNVVERIYRQAWDCFLQPNTHPTDAGNNTAPIIDDYKGLYIWVQHGHSRRGLERWSVPSVGYHRQEQRALLVHELLTIQYNSPNVSAKMLRKVSKSYSGPAKLYALAMGRADEEAAMAGHSSSSTF